MITWQEEVILHLHKHTHKYTQVRWPGQSEEDSEGNQICLFFRQHQNAFTWNLLWLFILFFNMFCSNVCSSICPVIISMLQTAVFSYWQVCFWQRSNRPSCIYQKWLNQHMATTVAKRNIHSLLTELAFGECWSSFFSVVWLLPSCNLTISPCLPSLRLWRHTAASLSFFVPHFQHLRPDSSTDWHQQSSFFLQLSLRTPEKLEELQYFYVQTLCRLWY